MKKIVSICLMIVALSSNAQRIYGYLPDYRDPSPSKIQYDKVTDIAFSFLNSDWSGNIITSVTADNAFTFNETRFLTAKSQCQNNGVNLWISVGGADSGNRRSDRLNAVCGNTSTRATFVSQLVNYAVLHQLYGLSIDWEFPTTPTAKNNHEIFISDLKTAIANSTRPSIKIAVAVGGETLGGQNHKQYLNSGVIALADEFHIMAYDFPTGNANYDNNNHSSLQDAKNSMQGWKSWGIPMSKQLLAVPFYGRTANRWSEQQYNDWPANATNQNADYYNGYYYNGVPTLEAKATYTAAQGAQGLVIWDLGQDQTGTYSLLTQLSSHIDGLCGAPKPNLGANIGICGTVNELLDGGVSAGGQLSFSWQKDGSPVGGNTPTYTAIDNGIYKLTVTHTGDNCSNFDEIEIAAGSPLSANGGSGCPNDPITLSVNNPQGGTVYEWFDALTSGTKKGEGNSISITTPETHTYYVQEKTSAVSYDAGMTGPAPGITNDVPWAWNNPLGQASHWIDVKTDLTIQSVMVSIYGNATGIKLQAVDQFGVVIAESGTTTVTGATPVANWEGKMCYGSPKSITLNTNLSLPTGQYFLVLVGTATNAADECGVDAGAALQPSSAKGDNELKTATATYGGNVVDGEEVSGVYFLEGACHINWAHTSADGTFPSALWDIDDARTTNDASHIHYGNLFNIVIVTGAASSCARAPADVLINNCTPLAINIDAPTDGSTLSTLSTTFDVTIAGPVTGVTYTISDGITSFDVNGDPLNGYSLDYTFATAGSYTITAKASDGSSTVNDVVSITVTTSTNPPTIGSISPAEGQEYKGISTISLTATITDAEGTVGTVTFEIYEEGNGAPIATLTPSKSGNVYSSNYTPPAQGNYTFKVTAEDNDANSTSSQTNFSVTAAVGFADNFQEIGIELYPNPSQGNFNLVLGTKTGVEVNIYDAQGSLIEKMTNATGLINIGEKYNSGVYIIQLNDNGILASEKIVKN